VRAEGGLNDNRLQYVVAEIQDPYALNDRGAGRSPLEMGRLVEAEITGRAQTDIVVLPRQALKGDQTVWLVGDDQRLQVREVDVLYRGRDTVFVRRGLRTGDQVALTALDLVIDGMRVQPLPASLAMHGEP